MPIPNTKQDELNPYHNGVSTEEENPTEKQSGCFGTKISTRNKRVAKVKQVIEISSRFDTNIQ